MRAVVLLVSTLCLTVTGASQALAESCSDWFKSNAPRFEEPQATEMAVTEPDCYAWRLFIALNWPADVSKKLADPAKAFGSNGPLVWETWRNARSDAPDSVFPLKGADPGPWLDAPITASVADRFEKPEAPLQLQEFLATLEAHGGGAQAFDDATAGKSVNETRLNRETFEFVRGRGLYNLDGQEKLFKDGVETISFPVRSKEVKAQWRVISEADKPRYYWVQSTTPQGVKIFGLTSLHITTKDLPNWFWATFEHIDNKDPAPATPDRPRAFGWQLPSVDRFACPTAPHDCVSIPAGIGLEGTHWENYRMRGTQTDFVDTRGRAIRLANSQPEGPFQMTSSCITCHALASISDKPGAEQRLPFFDDQGRGPLGVPTGFFDAQGKMQYTQLDFVWSLFRAKRKE